MAKWDNPIGIPFAESGDRSAIPDTSESGDVNNTTGFGNKYEVDPAVGGLWLYRQTMNSLFYNMFNSLKEIQTKVPISVNGSTPDVSGNISIPIPTADGVGIKVIDDKNTDITSFNQITEDGIYYIYKQLSDGPSQNGEAIKYGFIYLIVINVSIAAQNSDICMQMTSFGTLPYYIIPGNIGSTPMLRSYNKTSKQWGDWGLRHGIPFINNNIVISDFTIDKLGPKFPIIATDNTFPNGFNTFMYSATKAQMREQLGIADAPDLTDYFNKKTDKLDLGTQVTGQLKNSNIANAAITTSKVESLAITADKLASSSVTNDKITNGAVTDAKFSGTLSIAKGGTGTSDGYLFSNVMTFGELRTRFTALGSTAVTTEQFITAIKDSNKTAFKVNMVSAKSYISDFPLTNAILEVVRLTDNTVILTARDLFVLTTYEFRKNPSGVLSGWIKIRDSNGIIPMSAGGLGKPLTSTDASGIMYVSLESNETDINTMIKSGMYKCYRWINYPSDAGYTGQGFLYVFNWKETGSGSEIGYGFQLYINPVGKIYKRYRANSTFKQWKLIQNNDGSIPSDLIPPTVLTYTNDQGTWTETKLSDGRTMLEGTGYTRCNKQQTNNVCAYIAIIPVPKQLNAALYIDSQASINVLPSDTTYLFDYRAEYHSNINKIEIRRYYKDSLGSSLPPYISINWYIKGILL